MSQGDLWPGATCKEHLQVQGSGCDAGPVKGRARLRGDGYEVLPLRTSVVLPAVRSTEASPSRHPSASVIVLVYGIVLRHFSCQGFLDNSAPSPRGLLNQ